MKAFVFTHSRSPFLALLEQEGVEFQEPSLPSGVLMASGLYVVIPAVGAGLVKVIVAFLKARQSRKVVITTKDGVFNFQAEGLSQPELERTLELAQDISVIETRGDDV